MKLILQNGYPFPYPKDLTDEQQEALSEQAGRTTLEIAGVTNFQWLHTVTIEFAAQKGWKHYEEVKALTGWTDWDQNKMVMEAQTSAEDGYGHPAIIAGNTAYCGFILVDD